MSLRFTKMHGLGNDFVLIDARGSGHGDLSDLAKKICNRRFGVGADQMLVMLDSSTADLRMLIYNPDGSEVQMCGNGIRCFAKYAWEEGISDKAVLDIETLAGVIRPERSNGQVRVDMGEPRLEAHDIPVMLEGISGSIRDYPLTVERKEFLITCVSMGNPHTVIFVEGVDAFPVWMYGPPIENHPIFPERTNVEFVEVVDDRRLKMRVWERGAGETLACGTGASATLVAASIKGLTGREATVRLPGGDLEIEWGADNHVYMTGPAERVFDGEYYG